MDEIRQYNMITLMRKFAITLKRMCLRRIYIGKVLIIRGIIDDVECATITTIYKNSLLIKFWKSGGRQIILLLEVYTPPIHTKIVRWLHPPWGKFKYNTDSLVRFGTGSMTFCIGNEAGKMIYSESRLMENVSVIEVPLLTSLDVGYTQKAIL
ncbi:hypothetical protein H5410_040503 [Solanum commersonii]|uniref:Uncharacterized protein n=1 Tax=Solanum commersonii TaxID=4109 RepID=A0A9J5XQA4_SOLCO|nr:hypothetical protein H5410_040503 [Solanum commersonii]